MPKKVKGLTNDREIKHWLVNNSTGGNNWVVLGKLPELIMHEDKSIFNTKRQLIDKLIFEKSMSTGLKYVYSTYFTQKMLIALIQTNDNKYMIIKNTNLKETIDQINNDVQEQSEQQDPGVQNEEKTGSDNGNNDIKNDINNPVGLPEHIIIKSEITLSDSLPDIINYGFCKTDRKLLNIEKTDMIKLKQDQKIMMKDILPIDFMDCKTLEDKNLLWNKYIGEKRRDRYNNLDLSRIYNIGTETLSQTENTDFIKEIILYQNVQLINFSWLSTFKNVSTLGFWYCYQLGNESVKEICDACPGIVNLNFHNCFQLNIRALIPIMKLKNIKRVSLDNKLMHCQTNIYQGLITNKEWDMLGNSSITDLLINSDNLTVDVIDYILKAFIGLDRFLLNSLVMKKLYPCIIEGNGPEKIAFQSSDNPKEGFSAKKDIHLKNKLKNRFEEPMSESMKKLVEQQENGEDIVSAKEAALIEEIEKELADKYGEV